MRRKQTKRCKQILSFLNLSNLQCIRHLDHKGGHLTDGGTYFYDTAKGVKIALSVRRKNGVILHSEPSNIDWKKVAERRKR